MRLFKAGCAVFLVAFIVAYGVVISIPSVKFPKVVEEALAASAERHKGLGARLKNPGQNGFLNARLFPFVGGTEDKKGPVHDALAAWANAYSMQGVGGAVDHASLLKARDPSYLAARQGVKALLPDLVDAFSKPLFQPVNEDFTAPTKRANEDALTLLAMALNGYAESLMAEGKPEQAALVYEMVFREGSLIGNDSRVLSTMVGVSLQALACQSLVVHLSPKAKLGPNQWIGLSQSIAATAPTSLTLTQMLQNDLAYGTVFLQNPRSSYDGDARSLRGAYLLPGMRARDGRIFRNIMAVALDQSTRGAITESTPPATTAAVLKGVSGPGPQVLIPDYGRQCARINLHSAKMCGLAATFGICAYRAKYGKLPEKLGDLDVLGLQGPGAVPWSAAKGIRYVANGELAVVSVAVDPDMYARAGLNVEFAQEESKNSAYFRLKDGGYLFRF